MVIAIAFVGHRADGVCNGIRITVEEAYAVMEKPRFELFSQSLSHALMPSVGHDIPTFDVPISGASMVVETTLNEAH